MLFLGYLEVVIRMNNNISTSAETLRKKVVYQFVFYGGRLRELGALVNGPNESIFRKRYGNLLPLVNDFYEEWSLRVLLQFYNPQLRCFTFQDYQLAPTLEEYAYILDIKVTDSIPFTQVPETPNYMAITKALYLNVSKVEGNWIKKCDMQGIY